MWIRYALVLGSVLAIKSSHGQIGPDAAFRTVFNRVSVGLENVSREQEMERQEKAQREMELDYQAYIAEADSLFQAKQYEGSIPLYERALTKMEARYPQVQIDKARIEIARMQQDPYQRLVDQGDSLYERMEYEQAILRFQEALAQKQEPYPQKRIAKAITEIERLKTVHFSGLLISDIREGEFSSKAYADDPYADFVKSGKYASVDKTLIYANFQLLDGIAVPTGIRLVIYSEKNYKGTVLLDITGPAIVNNLPLRDNPKAVAVQNKLFTPGLERVFPAAVRSWSSSDMHSWLNGSMEITAP
jgi:tetratricopeptide (TPR) repeat protein